MLFTLGEQRGLVGTEAVSCGRQNSETSNDVTGDAENAGLENAGKRKVWNTMCCLTYCCFLYGQRNAQISRTMHGSKPAYMGSTTAGTLALGFCVQ